MSGRMGHARRFYGDGRGMLWLTVEGGAHD